MAEQVYSQNGWPAYPTTDRFVRFTACGWSGWAANADVAVIFTYVVERFHREVEPIDQGSIRDDWSYANRLVRGSTKTVSNHGSASAIDLNALKHPRGVRGTFSAAQAKALRKIRGDITDGNGTKVLRLGMDYTTVVDDMHIEINAGPRSVKQAADKIRARNKTKEKDMDLTKGNLEAIGKAFLSAEVELTEAAAEAIGDGKKEGDLVSVAYILQWSPLVRRAAREELERDRAEEGRDKADAGRDAALAQQVAGLAQQVRVLTEAVTRGGTSTGGVDLDALATAVADKLAARLQS